MAISKEGLVDGAPGSLVKLVNRLNGSIANQAASTAADVAGLKTDLNGLLTKLKASGLMIAD